MTGNPPEVDSAPPQPASLTRQQLYQLVWSEPVSQVAKRFGLTDVALIKLCRQHEVPTPQGGYWLKKRSGQVVRRPPLPKTEAAALATVQITPQPRTARVARVPVRNFDHDVAAMMAEHEARGAVVLPQSLEQAHKAVKKTLRELTRRLRRSSEPHMRPEWSDPRLPPISICVSDAQRDRALRIAEALLRSFEALGAIVEVHGEGSHQVKTTVTLLDEVFMLRIRERGTSRLFDPKRDKAERDFRGRLPDTVWEHNGRLQVVLKSTQQFGWDMKWQEEQPGSLDHKLARIVRFTIRRVQTQREHRAARQRWHEEQRIEDEARQRREEARRLESKRIEALIAMAARLDQAQYLRGFVAACRAKIATGSEAAPSTPVLEWLAWAEGVAAQIDPLTSGVEHAHRSAWELPPY